jgi:hypothetical protein
MIYVSEIITPTYYFVKASTLFYSFSILVWPFDHIKEYFKEYDDFNCTGRARKKFTSRVSDAICRTGLYELTVSNVSIKIIQVEQDDEKCIWPCKPTVDMIKQVNRKLKRDMIHKEHKTDQDEKR